MFSLKCLRNSITTVFLAGVLASAFGGCASPPKSFVEGVDYVTVHKKVRDAHVQHVAHHPELRVDDVLAERLDFIIESDDPAAARDEALRFLDQSHALALVTAHDEIEQLHDEGLAQLSRLYFEGEPTSHAMIFQAFRDETDVRVADLRRQVGAAATSDEVRAIMAPLRGDIETPVRRQGKTVRMLPWLVFAPISQAAIDRIYAEEERGSMDAPFVGATVYHLDEAGSLDAEYGQLLARCAPIIVQEWTAPDATYDPTVDEIGVVAARDDDTIEVRHDDAAVYAYAREVCIGGRPHVQLVYTHWYSEHPALEPDDPEAGHIEGVVFRVTLGTDLEPAFFETLYACGCYHRLYPSERLEVLAAAEFGRPMTGKTWSIERAVAKRKDLIVPALVASTGAGAFARPVIRVRAGWHGIVDVSYDVEKHPAETHEASVYTLRPYHELEHLTADNGHVTSMFYDNGLVKKAERPEGVYFTPAGILSAGQPRQRGTQLLHWDDWDFDDPYLFPHALRLPAGF